jgi:hypothetical protein
MTLFTEKDINSQIVHANLSPTVSKSSDGEESILIRSKVSEFMLNIFGKIQPGVTIEFCTAGQFSTHQLLSYLLNIAGPSNVYLSTWTLKEEPARVLYFLKKTGKIKQLHCVFDYRIRTLDAKHFDFLQSFIDKYTLTKCHAKVLAIEGENLSIAVISSANMSNNPRIEAGYISCNKNSMEFHRNWIMDVINGKTVA